MARKQRHIREKYVVGSSALAYDYTGEVNNEVKADKQSDSGNTTNTNKVNLWHTVAVITVVLLMMLVCVMMLKTQFTVANTSEKTIKLKHELTAVRRENAHLESIIQSNLDLVEIKRLAMEDYGMVYPSEDEVIQIATEASSYTVQYGEIESPSKERISIGNVLAFMTRGW